ncbi:response regulator, partial [Bacillus toyonensis]
DLVLLDIFMPEETGFELLMYIRNQEKEIDIMMISAVHDMGSIKKALQYGVVDYLIKPFTFERFKDALTIYREKLTFMKEQQKISQSELDSLILQKEKREPTVNKELPKGLTKQTLQLIWQKIESLNGRAFTTDEMAQLVGISRVSIRKYVMFLTEIGVLENEMVYQHVGRPVSKLRCVDQNKIGFYV